jgi:hypothetical protein
MESTVSKISFELEVRFSSEMLIKHYAKVFGLILDCQGWTGRTGHCATEYLHCGPVSYYNIYIHQAGIKFNVLKMYYNCFNNICKDRYNYSYK